MRSLPTLTVGFMLLALPGTASAQQLNSAQQFNYSFFNNGNREACRCTPDEPLCTLKYCSLGRVGNQCQRSCNNTNALGPPTSITIFPSDPSGKIQRFDVVPKGE